MSNLSIGALPDVEMHVGYGGLEGDDSVITIAVGVVVMTAAPWVVDVIGAIVIAL